MARKKSPRKKTAKTPTKRESAMQRYARLDQTPVDPEKFVFASNVYSSAAQRTMPVDARPFRKPDEPGEWLVLSDIPINRGMMAAIGELRSIGIDGDELHAYLFRLMHFGEIFEHEDALREFIQPGDTPDSKMVADALLKAVAIADVISEGGHSKLSVESLLEHARRFAAEDDEAPPASSNPDLPAPLVPSDVDVSDMPPPREAFVKLAMEQFGVSREDAEKQVDDAIAKTRRDH